MYSLPLIFVLAKLFNGKLVMVHRIKQLANWIEILKSKGYNINHIETSAKISLQDGWLSGFCDSEGCFNVNITQRKAMRVGYRVQLRFIMDQIDQTVLLLIKSLFGFGSVSYRTET